MAINFGILVLIAALTFLIGGYVLARSLAASHRAFAFFAFSVGLWTISIAIAHNIPRFTWFFARLSFATASLMLLGLLLLVVTFPRASSVPWNTALSLLVGVSACLSVLSLTRLVVVDAALGNTGLRVTYGSLYPLYAFYVYACFAAALFLLARKYGTSSGLARLQLSYLLLGLVVPGLLVTITNLLIPLLSGNSRTGQYGPYLAVVFLTFTAHALIRYRLMDIRLVIKRGVTLLLALTISIFVLSAVLLTTSRFLPFDTSTTELLLLLTGGAFIGTLVPLLRWPLTKLLDRYVYRVSVNYARVLRETSNSLTAILDLDRLAASTLDTLTSLIVCEHVALYLERLGTFDLHAARATAPSTPAPPSTLSASSSIVTFLSRWSEALVLEEIPHRLSPAAATLLFPTMRRLAWALVLPIRSESSLQGFICVGPKLSGDAFFPDEIEFLSTLTNQVAIGLHNARLYKKVTLANEYVNNLLATIDSGVVSVDALGRLTLCNNAALRLISGHLSNQGKESLADLPTGIADPLRATLGDGHPRSYVESTLRDREGRLTPVACATSALHDRDGTVLGAVAVVNDVSQVKQLDAERRRAERLAAFGALASGIAHEIKNPLVAIRTFAELLPERFADHEFRRDFAQITLKEVERIDDLVARLRGLAASTRTSLRRVDLSTLIDDTLTLLRAQLLQRHVAVEKSLRSATGLVTGDEDQLRQLLLNVFMNALEAMEGGGTLIVALSERSSKNAQPLLRLEITDSGPGISEAILSRIFDPFVTTKPHGSGLGLAICREIADAHRATIDASNASGRGATITIDFPVFESPRPIAGDDPIAFMASPQDVPS